MSALMTGYHRTGPRGSTCSRFVGRYLRILNFRSILFGIIGNLLGLMRVSIQLNLSKIITPRNVGHVGAFFCNISRRSLCIFGCIWYVYADSCSHFVANFSFSKTSSSIFTCLTQVLGLLLLHRLLTPSKRYGCVKSHRYRLDSCFQTILYEGMAGNPHGY